MIYHDRVYGPQEITEPIVLELLASPVLERLKGVDQYGYFEAYFSGTASSRYDHSVGVYLLLKKYGAPLTEQIAGLIHDVSHTVFSHCIDYALTGGDQKGQSHQDSSFPSFLKESNLLLIFEKYGFNLDYILNDENFPLKEQPLPDLCADRLDYSLRDAMKFTGLTPEKVKNILDDLRVENGQWFFINQTAAEDYARLFLNLNRNYYCGLPSAMMLHGVGDYLNYALEKNYILPSDLYTTDQTVLKKIEKFWIDDDRLRPLFDRLNNKVAAKNDPVDYDDQVFCKSRAVDPLFKDGSTLERLSEVSPEWKKILVEELRPKEYFLKFEK
jgi:HD superfamily phosphohydrolase